MSKRKKAAVIAGIIVILFVISAYFSFPLKPLASLDMTDIEEIFVFTVPPEQEIMLRHEEMEKAVKLLQEVKAYQPGYIANSTVGQYVKFSIIRADGTKIEVVVEGNITIMINGVSYRAEYSSAEAISSFANDILY